ncbi:ABC transporter ATP-binding protein [Azorhizobium oxalatiphilum]|uniref:ABC transporter ATP-binding protein n=1 Tax=Azorhizobium oxalatiphilum TaxID=980631 RepID=A0A917BM25_9HYPH|nr:ABC transporter ATP-binding protein [Azorhizobium oxalatiphilum]GGF51439.1 ABC transporter ATP-binding protein [Azorhizobium oxalatiphilum]
MQSANLAPPSPQPGALIAHGLNLSFGGIEVLKGVDLDLRPGLVTGLIGPNGAGKTSLFNCLTGLYRPTAGRIALGDTGLDALSPARRAGLGMVRSFQHMALSPDLTLLENVMTGLTLSRRSGWASAFLPLPGGRAETQDAQRRAMAALDELGIAAAAHLAPPELPPGTQRLGEIARALVAHPRVLLLDEPAAGLNAVETRDLTRALRRVMHPGLIMVVVEHDMDLIMQLCDRIYVLNFGKVIACGSPAAVQADPEVLRVYLGADDE